MTDPDVVADLRSYYETEARLGTRQDPSGDRIRLRTEFVDLLRAEGRTSVVDFGSGPGRDGQAFVDAGIRYAGLDLAHGNAVLAAGRGLTVGVGSIATPPLRGEAAEAGWCMSTLMHVPEADAADVAAAMASRLTAGAPFVIAQWGGERRDIVDSHRIETERRLFSLRPFDLNRTIVEAAGVIEAEDCWFADDEWQYHVFRVRTR